MNKMRPVAIWVGHQIARLIAPVLAFAIPTVTLATGSGSTFFDSSGELQSGSQLGQSQPDELAATLVNLLLSFLGVIVLILIIWGGFVWMTAAGNEEKVTKAQGILRAAIIGLLIVLASYGISLYAFNTFEDATGVA